MLFLEIGKSKDEKARAIGSSVGRGSQLVDVYSSKGTEGLIQSRGKSKAGLETYRNHGA